MPADSTSLRTAIDELREWNELATVDTAEERETRIQSWLAAFARLSHHDLGQPNADWPPLLLAYAWYAITLTMPESFRLNIKQTASLDEVWKHDFTMEEEDDVDDTYDEFVDKFVAFVASYADLHTEIALQVELALLGRYGAHLLKTCDHRVAAAHSTTMVEVTQGVLEDLQEVLEDMKSAESACQKYVKWRAGFMQGMGSLWNQQSSRPSSNDETASTVVFEVAADTQAGAPSVISASIIEPFSLEPASTEADISHLIRDASTLITSARARIISSRYRAF
jgi:hypothetical protein